MLEPTNIIQQNTTDGNECPKVPNITYVVGNNNPQNITESDLTQEGLNRLQQVFKTGKDSSARINLTDDLLAFSSNPLRSLLDILTSCDANQNINIRFATGDEIHGDMFDAILEILPDGSDPDRYARGKELAIYVAALRYPNSINLMATRLNAKLKSLNIKGNTVALLRKEMESAVSKLQFQSLPGRQRVKEVLPDAPVPEEAVFPRGFNCRPEGIKWLVGKDGDFIPLILLISGICKSINGDEDEIAVDYYWNSEFIRATFSRSILADSRKIIEAMTRKNVPVNSNIARACVQYLNDYEIANRDNIPVQLVSHKLGWISRTSGQDSFLLGKEQVAGLGSPEVSFSASYDGALQAIEGYHAAGSFEAWQEAVKNIRQHPLALFGIYASFGTPLLRIVDAPNLCISFEGQTSTGKTSCLRLCVSVWGDPNENNASSLLKSWNSTFVFLERTMGISCDLPLFLDDSKAAIKDEIVSKTLYCASQGQTRGRGTITGTVQKESWRTILFSTGEEGIDSFGKHGGAHARTISIPAPFGSVSEVSGKMVTSLNQAIRHNYGHAGPMFVEYLVNNQDKWETWKERFHDLENKLRERAGADNVLGRMISYIALVYLAAELVHEAQILPWDLIDPTEDIWCHLKESAQQADLPTAAMEMVLGFITSHPDRFCEFPSYDRVPIQGIAGRIEETGQRFSHNATHENSKNDSPWKWVAFIPNVLKKVLTESGYDMNSCLRAWREKDWISCDQNRLQKNVRFRGKTQSMVVITSNVFRDAIGYEGKP